MSATKMVQRFLTKRREKLEMKKEKKRQQEEQRREQAASIIALARRRAVCAKRCAARAAVTTDLRRKASTRIQMFMVWHFRTLPNCRRHRTMRHRQESAAMSIQRYFRDGIARIYVARVEAARRVHAAMEIQRVYRGKQGRVHFQQRRQTQLQRRTRAATKMQSLMRGVRGRRVAMDARRAHESLIRLEIELEMLLEKQQAASLSFQTHAWRPYRARTIYHARVAARNVAQAKKKTAACNFGAGSLARPGGSQICERNACSETA
jgi:hypothetical protein